MGCSQLLVDAPTQPGCWLRLTSRSAGASSGSCPPRLAAATAASKASRLAAREAPDWGEGVLQESAKKTQRRSSTAAEEPGSEGCRRGRCGGCGHGWGWGRVGAGTGRCEMRTNAG